MSPRTDGSMNRSHCQSPNKDPDHTITDHDRGVTVRLWKQAPRQWKFIVRLAELERDGAIRPGGLVCEGIRVTTRRADSLALELAKEAEPQARSMITRRTAEHEARQAAWRRQAMEQLERDQANAPAVAARLLQLVEFGDPQRRVAEWRRGDVIETAPFRPGTGKPVSAAQFTTFTVIAADRTDPDVFAVCTAHKAIYGTYSQGHARELVSNRDRWCPGCKCTNLS